MGEGRKCKRNTTPTYSMATAPTVSKNKSMTIWNGGEMILPRSARSTPSRMKNYEPTTIDSKPANLPSHAQENQHEKTKNISI